MSELDVRLLLSKGSIQGPYRRRGWFWQLLDFLLADKPDLSINSEKTQ